jgi:hypothetical protein
VSREPFCLYIGKNTRCSIPQRHGLVQRTRSQVVLSRLVAR